MITEQGELALREHITRQGVNVFEDIVLGTGEAEESATDKSLSFEVVRVPVDLVEVVGNEIIVRGFLPDNLIFDAYEAGLAISNTPEEVVSRMITRFDSDNEDIEWSPHDVSSGGRIGQSSILLSVDATESETLERYSSPGAYGLASSSDQFAMAYQIMSGDVDSVEVRFIIDSSNYRTYSFVPESGYSVERWPRSQFVQEGSAPWDSDFAELHIVVTAGATPCEIIFDGMRFDNISSEDGSDILISRTVLQDPITKSGVTEMQVEYKFEVSFNQ